MANQALINAAQRMYSAKAAKAQKDITPILSGVASATDNIMNAVTVKRKEQQEESQKQIESFKDILLKNPKLRPELTGRLEQLQEEYYNNLKVAEGAFVGKKRKADAIEANNKIADQLKKYESQLNSVDLNKSLNTSFSKFNMLGDQVDDTIFRDKTLIDNVVLQDDGFYFKNHKGELTPLDEYKPLMQVNEKGISSLVSGFTAAENAGFKGRSYTGGIEQQIDTLINFELGANKNYQSILFDDIGTFNYAEANLQQEIDAGRIDGKLSKSEQLEKFKENIKANPDFYRQDFKNDYVAVVKQANANALAQYETEKNEIESRRIDGKPKPYQLTTPGAQYVGKDYIEDVYDQIKKGAVIIGAGKSINTYFRDKDGLFYSSDSNSKLVKTAGAEGVTDEAMARMRGVDTFANEFGYEFTSPTPEVQEKGSEVAKLKAQLKVLQADADEASVKASGATWRPTREKNKKILELKNRDIQELKNKIQQLESQQ